MLQAMNSEKSFSIREARLAIADLFDRHVLRYWIDLILSMAVGYSSASVYLSPEFSWPARLGALVVAAFALFRVGSFIHEITHMREGEMRAFRAFWDLACGIPMVMPSFFYENHIDHHNARHYGTQADGEYVPLGTSTWHQIVLFFSQALVMPLLLFVRFLLSPLTFITPRVRQWTLERCSSFVFNWHHRLAIPATAPRRSWAAIELACCLRCWIMLAVVWTGPFDWARLPAIYVLAVAILSLNYLRNLAAHHYRNRGERMTHLEQLEDSVNITGGPLTELFFPLNLRYHALHHLFPSLPYHNLGRAHRRLMAALPANSLYRDTVYPSFWAVVAELLRDTRAASRAQRRRARVARGPGTSSAYAAVARGVERRWKGWPGRCER